MDMTDDALAADCYIAVRQRSKFHASPAGKMDGPGVQVSLASHTTLDLNRICMQAQLSRPLCKTRIIPSVPSPFDILPANTESSGHVGLFSASLQKLCQLRGLFLTV